MGSHIARRARRRYDYDPRHPFTLQSQCKLKSDKVRPSTRLYMKATTPQGCAICDAEMRPSLCHLVAPVEPLNHEIRWMVDQRIALDTFGKNDPANLICLCLMHHLYFVNGDFVILPSLENMLELERQEVEDFDRRVAHPDRGRTVPDRSKLANEFTVVPLRLLDPINLGDFIFRFWIDDHSALPHCHMACYPVDSHACKHELRGELVTFHFTWPLDPIVVLTASLRHLQRPFVPYNNDVDALVRQALRLRDLYNRPPDSATLKCAIDLRPEPTLGSAEIDMAARRFMLTTTPGGCAICGGDRDLRICHLAGRTGLADSQMHLLVKDRIKVDAFRRNEGADLMYLCQPHRWEMVHGKFVILPCYEDMQRLERQAVEGFAQRNGSPAVVRRTAGRFKLTDWFTAVPLRLGPGPITFGTYSFKERLDPTTGQPYYSIVDLPEHFQALSPCDHRRVGQLVTFHFTWGLDQLAVLTAAFPHLTDTVVAYNDDVNKMVRLAMRLRDLYNHIPEPSMGFPSLRSPKWDDGKDPKLAFNLQPSDRLESDAISPETRRFMKTTTPGGCAICGSMGLLQVCHVVARTALADYQIHWMVNRRIAVDSFRKDEGRNLIYLCSIHHGYMDRGHYVILPSLENMRKLEQQELANFNLRAGTPGLGRTIPDRSKLSDHFTVVPLRLPSETLFGDYNFLPDINALDSQPYCDIEPRSRASRACEHDWRGKLLTFRFTWGLDPIAVLTASFRHVTNAFVPYDNEADTMIRQALRLRDLYNRSPGTTTASP